ASSSPACLMASAKVCMLSEVLRCAVSAWCRTCRSALEPISAAVSRRVELESVFTGLREPGECVAAAMRILLCQAKEREDREDHDNEADQIDDGVHGALPMFVRMPNKRNRPG